MSDKSFLDAFGKTIPNDRPAGIDELAKVLAEERGAAATGNATSASDRDVAFSGDPVQTA